MNLSIHNEDKCLFVSTIGLALCADQKPTYIGRQIQYHFNYDNQPNEIVYVKSCHLIPFSMQELDKFRNPIIIITNNDDVMFPSDIIQQYKPAFDKLISEQVSHIFCQNCDVVNHPKISAIPIGIDYHTLNWESNYEWGTGGRLALEQEKELIEIRKMMKPIKDCDPTKIITNFQLAMTDPPRRREARMPIYECLKDKPWMTWLPKQPRADFWKSCKDIVFVISPQGNAVDCHRTIEVLCLGKIPIIEDHPLNVVYEKLPVWIIKDWKEFASLTEEDFKKKHQEFVDNWSTYDWKHITLHYWKNKIRSMK